MGGRKKMSVPLRVPACGAAVALTLTPEIAGSPAAAAEPAVVEIHHQDDQLRQHRERQELLMWHRQERHLTRHRGSAGPPRLRHTVRLKRARMIARWQVRADRAVRFAHRQRGKPYRWGGTGPR